MRKLIAALSAVMMLVATPAMSFAGGAYFILDAKTGHVLGSANADVKNHPASLTKMMTMYLAFEAVHHGKLRWNSQLRVSKYASARPPTKLFLKPGSTISLRDAVNGMITRSANDAATVVAEAIGGSESNFAAMMTAKARQLGMSRSSFVNASGLPDTRQISTARDMSTLAVALINDFPSEYKLFSQRSFMFHGHRITGHNHLMARYQGMDGIKTGYTNASGFNLVSAVKRGNRRVIGVVFGGRTARSRDDYMAALLDRYFDKATPLANTRLVASVDTRRLSPSVQVASAAATADIPVPSGRSLPEADAITTSAITRPAAESEIRSAGKPETGSWLVQIAATPSAQSAHALLEKAKARTGTALKGAALYTETVAQGSSTLYRARFVGFASRDAAEAACKALKRNDFACLMMQDQG